MAGLKRTPVGRLSGAELVQQIVAETAELPPTRREPEPGVRAGGFGACDVDRDRADQLSGFARAGAYPVSAGG